jgi:helicase MOV-10
MYEFVREFSISDCLTESQKDAIFAICNKEHGVSPFILNGPPGTGKTLTIVEAIKAILRMDESNRVLICTPANFGADRVAEELMKHFGNVLNESNVLRLRSPSNDFKVRDRKFDSILNL